MGTEIIAVAAVLAFVVNITVQLTKEIIPLPTQLWTVAVSLVVTIASACAAAERGVMEMTSGLVVGAIAVSFVIAYISMYGFDMFKNLWNRFKDGENINKE